MLEQTLYTLLAGSQAIKLLVGSGVYPLLLPESPSLPAISYSVISTTAAPTLSSNGTQRYRVEVNCWGSSYSDAVTLRAAVISSLNCWYDGITTCEFISSHDQYEPDPLQYRAICEFYFYTVNFGASLPTA